MLCNFKIFYIGSNEGWHGYIDVMIGCEDPAASEGNDKDDNGSVGTNIYKTLHQQIL